MQVSNLNWKVLKKYLVKYITIKINNNIIFVKGPLGLIKKQFLNKRNKYYYSINYSHLIIRKSFLLPFLKDLNKLIIGVLFGWFLVLTIKGRGFNFRIKKIKNKTFLKFKIGYSHYVYYLINDNYWIKISKKKTKLFIFGLDFWKLMKLGYQIRNLRSKHIYKIQGISFLNEEIIVKPGKQQLL